MGYGKVVTDLSFVSFGLGLAVFLVHSITVISNVNTLFFLLKRAEGRKLKKTISIKCEQIVSI